MSKAQIIRDVAGEDTLTVSTKCPQCGGHSMVNVPRAGYMVWLDGVPIQRAMPELTASERELLMTGLDDKCWDRMFDEGPEGAAKLIGVIRDARANTL